jgi:hypothetical protein
MMRNPTGSQAIVVVAIILNIIVIVWYWALTTALNITNSTDEGSSVTGPHCVL